MQQFLQDAFDLLRGIPTMQLIAAAVTIATAGVTIITAIVTIVGAIWAVQKWRYRDEHFPRIAFEVNVNFIGRSDQKIACELVAILENKGFVPLKLKNFTFLLRGLSKTDDLCPGSAKIRNQLNFHRELCEGSFIPGDWPWTFIYPGVRTEYNFVTTIPADTRFVRMESEFLYLRGKDNSHHAARVLSVPDFSAAKES
ncbi:hypothetical protein CO665_02325 [Rhizobium anhuiense]|uniref:hypothetical protein n=1 Tax=Rhizobium anhuiense TaxID=1184720 RepID=UPI000BE89A6F|nr:hypothetical protein [Rhizobium anhuiense]PDS40276.1 hypothetical protein CO665_02325 [Rhizobium anhuiense]